MVLQNASLETPPPWEDVFFAAVATGSVSRITRSLEQMRRDRPSWPLVIVQEDAWYFLARYLSYDLHRSRYRKMYFVTDRQEQVAAWARRNLPIHYVSRRPAQAPVESAGVWTDLGEFRDFLESLPPNR
jgi:hypothetical protein